MQRVIVQANLRVPADLHQQICEYKEITKQSLNASYVALLQAGLQHEYEDTSAEEVSLASQKGGGK